MNCKNNYSENQMQIEIILRSRIFYKEKQYYNYWRNKPLTNIIPKAHE